MKRKVVKSLSTLMALSMCVPTQAFAADVTEYQTINATQIADADVIINGGDSHFTVSVPKAISASGKSGILSYKVDVDGDIAGGDIVSVVPDKSFELKQDRKTPVTAIVSQDKESWSADEFDIDASGEISYDGLSSGTWQGVFNFNVNLNKSSSISVVAHDSEGRNLNASATEITGAKKDNLLASLEESGLASANEVDALIEVKSDNFEGLADTTFDVSSIASEGDTVAILHFNHNDEWELVAIERVDANGCVSGNFSDYSPVAFAKMTENGEFIPVIKDAGLYDVDGNMLCALTADDFNNRGFSPSNNLPQSKRIDNAQVTEVVIPEGVTSIGNYAFYRCTSLTSVTIPNSVTSIDTFAFSCCSSLTSVTIPNSVTNIGSQSFSCCSSLTSVTIPNSVTSIGGSAFSSCTSLTSVTIPDSVTSILTSTFNECSSLTSVTIPDSVTSIGSRAFNKCSSLTSVTIPNSVTNIGSQAFYSCSKLTSVTVPEGVMDIGSCAFYGCKSLTSIAIPDSATSIGDKAFYNVPHIYYNGPATGSPWGALAIN